MIYTIALLATVVVSRSIEHPLVNETVLAKEFRPVSNGAFAQDAQVSDDEWFNQIPLKGKGPNGCDFSDMDIASLYHLRLVEAHPMYIACQRGSVKTGAEPQLSRNMKRDGEVDAGREVATPFFEDLEVEDLEEDLEPVNFDDFTRPQPLKMHPDHFETEEAKEGATLIAVVELTKELETLKAGLPAASGGKIENLELYEPIKRKFKEFLRKVRPLDTRYNQVVELNRGIEDFSQTISRYNDMAEEMCNTIKASYCVHFNHWAYHSELLGVQEGFITLEKDMKSNKKKVTEELLQSYQSRFDALKSRYEVVNYVQINQWKSFQTYYITVIDDIDRTYFEVKKLLSEGRYHL